jgi:protein-tyrosine kinase
LSFIDKALERAKALNKKQEKVAPIRGLQEPSPGIPSAISVGATEDELIPQEISYHVTRTVAVDHETMRRNRLIVGGGEAEAAAMEGYKMLRTHILQRTREEGHNTLMITGPLPGEGKTVTSINLAISIAQEMNQTVLLVDADLRAPSVHQYFGLPEGEGLVDYLTAGVPISELLVHPEGLDKLVLLPGGKPAAQAPELINSPLMRDLVQELKHFYPNRYVLFDLPPLLTYADALAFAPLVDGIIVVVEAGKTAREDIERCREKLEKFNLLGFVLNKAEVKPAGQYYRYRQADKPAIRKKFKLPSFK